MRIETIGIGVIGSGYMGLTYCECVSRNVNGSRLIAIAGGRRAAGLAKEYDVDVEDSAQELFERADVHAVVIATPDQNRRELTEQAAAAGKHVLVEKPMAPTVKDCDAMMADCNKAGVSLGVIQSNRFRKVSRRTKQLIDDGGIGPIQMLRSISAFPLTITKQLFADRKWYLDKSSGGFFMGMAVHNVDFLRWLTGRNATKVFATGNTYSTIEALDVLANSYGRLDESTFSIKSDSFFQEYLKLAKSIDNPTLNYWVACSEGNSFEFKGMHDRAKVHFEKALEMAIILQDSALHSEALLNLGENAQRQNDPRNSISLTSTLSVFSSVSITSSPPGDRAPSPCGMMSSGRMAAIIG